MLANYTVNSLAAEAKRRGIVVSEMAGGNILVLQGMGREVKLLGTITDQTSHLAVRFSDDKRFTKHLLSLRRIPHPRSYSVDSIDEAINAFYALGCCVAMKPCKGYKGRGVSVKVMSEEDVSAAFHEAVRFHRIVLVEEHVPGRDYRLLVVGGAVVAASERLRTHVVGDGLSTIGELIDELNRDPRRGGGDDTPLAQIVIDGRLERLLARSFLTLTSVPMMGCEVFIQAMGSVSMGSESIDCTDAVHPDLAKMARDAADVVGLDIAGIDMISSDISLSAEDSGAQVIEVNCSPGLRPHMNMSDPSSPARHIISHLFPESISLADRL